MQLDIVLSVPQNSTFLSNGCSDNINDGISTFFGFSTKNEISFNIRPNQNYEDGQILGHR